MPEVISASAESRPTWARACWWSTSPTWTVAEEEVQPGELAAALDEQCIHGELRAVLACEGGVPPPRAEARDVAQRHRLTVHAPRQVELRDGVPDHMLLGEAEEPEETLVAV